MIIGQNGHIDHAATIRTYNQNRRILPTKPIQQTNTPEIVNRPGVGYISLAIPLSTMVGYWQSLRLSIAPLKLTQASMKVKSPQFGAQKATGSSYRAHNQ